MESPQMVCATCRRVLNSVTITSPKGETTTWQHPCASSCQNLNPVSYDQLSEGQIVEICDICFATPVTEHFSARPLPWLKEVGTSLDFIHANTEGWAACAPCARYIRAKRLDQLLQRGMKALRRKASIQPPYDRAIRAMLSVQYRNLMGLPVDPVLATFDPATGSLREFKPNDDTTM